MTAKHKQTELVLKCAKRSNAIYIYCIDAIWVIIVSILTFWFDGMSDSGEKVSVGKHGPGVPFIITTEVPLSKSLNLQLLPGLEVKFTLH